MLRIKKGRIINIGTGRPVHLKGFNLGGWLMPEAYFVQAPSRPVAAFRRAFTRACGEDALRALETAFRGAFITREDFKAIAALGCNSVRLPFHFGLIEESPYVYSREGLGYIDRAIRWAKECGLWVILDMHAVPGAQNADWHSDSDGTAKFWTSASAQARAAALWGFLADRYKDEPTVAGYDVLNEAVLDDPRRLNKYYHQAIKAIRASDKAHIIFIEGDRWAQDLDVIDDFSDEDLALSFHFYEPLEFTHHFIQGITYPQTGKALHWGKGDMRRRIDTHLAVARKRGRALWCGEFGVNARGGFYGEDIWLKDMLAQFNAAGIHWSYWTWKSVKNHMFPDGVYSYVPDPSWVNRRGPLSGWDTWHRCWQDHKKGMIASWRTAAFTPNREIVEVLRQAL